MSALLSLALVGYGAMGKELERLAAQAHCRVDAVFDADHPIDVQAAFDVAIDFSLPGAVLHNVRTLAAMKKNIVLGTTGWSEHATEIRRIVQDAGVGLIYGSNFSVGVQMFFRIVRAAARLANAHEDYDVFMHELHHTRKADSPSGTALTLAHILLDELDRKTDLLGETSHGKIVPGALHVSSTRGGEIPGTHTVYIDSIADTIELTHRARNRSGFALGALRAAHWIHGKTGVYDFSEVFEEIGGNSRDALVETPW